MKVSLNIKFVDGPFGGAMQFAQSIRDYLQERGHTVINHLCDNDIDIILHIAPFPFQEICSFTYIDASLYKLKHQNTKIILRVNIVDEGKGTKYMNASLCAASKYSDHLVFIASWLRPLLEKKGLPKDTPSSVILNGADHQIFNSDKKTPWNSVRKMKIVTHHWSSNFMKGHNIYKKIDDLLSIPEFSKRFVFTFIGNIPQNLEYKNTNLIKPLFGEALADELRSHDVYITAARNEAGGMHHIEGALCGLPILYLESGALPEYCHEYGLSFDASNLEEKLLEMHTRYNEFYPQLRQYPYTSDYMNAQYLKLCEQLVSHPIQPKRSPTRGIRFVLFCESLWLSIKSFEIRIKDFLRAYRK